MLTCSNKIHGRIVLDCNGGVRYKTVSWDVLEDSVEVDYKVPTTSVRELNDVNGTNVIYMTGDFEL